MNTSFRPEVSPTAPTEMGIDFDKEQAKRTQEKERQELVVSMTQQGVDFDAFHAERAATRTEDVQRAQVAKTILKEQLSSVPASGIADAASPYKFGENRFHDRAQVAAQVARPKSFLQNLVNAPRDAWKMLFGEPPKYSPAPEKQSATPVLVEETSNQRANTLTQFEQIDPSSGVDAKLRAMLKAGVLDEFGTPSRDLAANPESFGLTAADVDAISKRQVEIHMEAPRREADPRKREAA